MHLNCVHFLNQFLEFLLRLTIRRQRKACRLHLLLCWHTYTSCLDHWRAENWKTIIPSPVFRAIWASMGYFCSTYLQCLIPSCSQGGLQSRLIISNVSIYQGKLSPGTALICYHSNRSLHLLGCRRSSWKPLYSTVQIGRGYIQSLSRPVN